MVERLNDFNETKYIDESKIIFDNWKLTNKIIKIIINFIIVIHVRKIYVYYVKANIKKAIL